MDDVQEWDEFMDADARIELLCTGYLEDIDGLDSAPPSSRSATAPTAEQRRVARLPVRTCTTCGTRWDRASRRCPLCGRLPGKDA